MYIWPIFHQKKQVASVTLAILSFGVLGFLLLLGFSISQLRITQATQNLEVEFASLKLRTVAQAGLQEAISTRLFPAGNRLAWGFNTENEARTTADPQIKPQPFYFTSSYVYSKEPGQTDKLQGRYQYVVIGANPYLNTSFEFNTQEAANAPELRFIQYPILIASRGIICVNPSDNTLAMDQLEVENYNYTCETGTVAKTETLIARLEPTNAQTGEDFKVLWVKELPEDKKVRLDFDIPNRDGKIVREFSFDEWWKNTGIHESPGGAAFPIAYRYATYNSAANYAINGYELVAGFVESSKSNLTTVNLTSKKAYLPYLELFFQGAIDERTLYTVGSNFVYQPEIITGGTETAGVALRRGSSQPAKGRLALETLYPGATKIMIQGEVPCQEVSSDNNTTVTYAADRLVFNSQGQLRDSEGFENKRRYEFIMNRPCLGWVSASPPSGVDTPPP